jgi:hypothetical protein
MAAGILVANVLRFAQDVMKKGPQAMMAEMAMKQMMKGMPGAAGGMGGAPGAMPGAMPGAPSPFGPYGTANPFAPGFKPPAAAGAVDTTAAPVSSSSGKPTGEKFAARKEGGSGASGSGSNGASTSKADEESSGKPSTSSSSKPLDVVEAASVKEPESAKASAGPAAGSFFTDVGAGGAGGGAGAAGAGFGGAAAGGAANADPGRMTAMMEKMLRDPNMQKLLYPYLPEPMRNEQSIEWMLSNPQVRAQMEQVFAQQGAGMSPELMEMMSQVDFSQDKVQQQFSQLGLDPQQVMQMVMNDPQLAAGFANPKVQRAVFEISQDPNNAAKYQDDPEVLAVLEKVTALFAPQMAAAGGGMPGGMPGMPTPPGAPSSN